MEKPPSLGSHQPGETSSQLQPDGFHFSPRQGVKPGQKNSLSVMPGAAEWYRGLDHSRTLRARLQGQEARTADEEVAGSSGAGGDLRLCGRQHLHIRGPEEPLPI
uniref:Uncharacterized protein n=1 Tax=Sphaerodactylus townsendi TaxID=933632 RepID=A0ACB8ETJ3_9SAUR